VRRGHAPLNFGAGIMRPWVFPSVFWKSFLNAPWGFARSRSHASVPLLLPRPLPRLSVSCASRYSPLALRIRETPAWAIAARRRVLAAWAFYLRSASFCAPDRRDINVSLCGSLAGNGAMWILPPLGTVLTRLLRWAGGCLVDDFDGRQANFDRGSFIHYCRPLAAVFPVKVQLGAIFDLVG